jgi:hypothetical protein
MRPKTSPPRIFVVDDDPAIASTLAAILDMLVKPVFPSQLLSEIEKICDEREWRTDTVGQVGPHIVGNHRLNKTPEA